MRKKIPKSKKQIYLILHNIRSAHNVGSIFRTADGIGASKIFLTGYTPAPIDVFGKTRKEIAKTALGAEKFVEWEKIKNITNLIKNLKNKGFFVVAVEQSSKSIDYLKFKPKFPLAIILGNEVKGLNKSILNKSDKIVQIPMKGKKESLNVSVAAGIILYSI